MAKDIADSTASARNFTWLFFPFFSTGNHAIFVNLGAFSSFLRGIAIVLFDLIFLFLPADFIFSRCSSDFCPLRFLWRTVCGVRVMDCWQTGWFRFPPARWSRKFSQVEVTSGFSLLRLGSRAHPFRSRRGSDTASNTLRTDDLLCWAHSFQDNFLPQLSSPCRRPRKQLSSEL